MVLPSRRQSRESEAAKGRTYSWADDDYLPAPGWSLWSEDREAPIRRLKLVMRTWLEWLTVPSLAEHPSWSISSLLTNFLTFTTTTLVRVPEKTDYCEKIGDILSKIGEFRPPALHQLVISKHRLVIDIRSYLSSLNPIHFSVSC